MISGKMVSTTTGKIYVLGEGYRPLTRKDILFRYFENKESPIASFITQLLEGKTNTGAPLDIPTAVADRFVPMLAQDLYDISKEGGSLFSIIPNIFGVGGQTYSSSRANPYGLGGVLTGAEERHPSAGLSKTSLPSSKPKPKVSPKVKATPKPSFR
jgi:hypothetical protein